LAFADVALTRTAELAMVCVIAFMSSSCCVARRAGRCGSVRISRVVIPHESLNMYARTSRASRASRASSRRARSMSRRARGRATRAMRVTLALSTLALVVGTRGRVAALEPSATAPTSASTTTTTRWRELALDEDAFETLKSYDRPSYSVDDDGRARFKGWFSNTATTEAGSDALATPLPEEARPRRDEPWKVTMKGVERTLTVTMDGKMVVGDEYGANTWFVLNGLEFNTAAARAKETCDATSGSCAHARDEL
jgi:hypothetical protein